MSFALQGYRTLRSWFGGYGLEYVFPFSVIHRKIREKIKTNKAMVHGHTMYLDEYDSLCLSIDEDFEIDELSVVRERVGKGDVVLDVGANIGYYTLEFARIVGKKGKVYAFEPNDVNFELLKKNVEVNNYSTQVVLEKKAVMDVNGNMKLYLHESNFGDHRAFDSGDDRNVEQIKAVNIDSYLGKKLKRVDFIKLDIQGSEHKAVVGMKQLIERQKKVSLLTEYWPVGLALSGIEPVDYLVLLEKLGFELWEIDKKSGQLKAVEKSIIEREITAENGKAMNLLAKKV